MTGTQPGAQMLEFFALVSDRLPPNRADMATAWSTHSNEALWARSYLDAELKRLGPGAKILDVGAGIRALSGQLAREGFEVTALEPVGIGFDTLGELGQLVQECYAEIGITFEHLPCRAEEVSRCDEFDFAFAINVLEHVDSVETVLDRVVTTLRPGARFRFRCPNYDFPYESHFGWIIPPSKPAAQWVANSRLAHSQIPQAQGLWESLNWISVRQIRAWARTRDDAQLLLNPDALHEIWIRAKTDTTLMERHSGPLTQAVRFADRIGAAGLLRTIPVAVQPVIDGRIIRTTAVAPAGARSAHVGGPTAGMLGATGGLKRLAVSCRPWT
jgi:2-polyprenyl-3-methyl-5-hydroxy-6-metoxy-1,4-benzoquinol methylase